MEILNLKWKKLQKLVSKQLLALPPLLPAPAAVPSIVSSVFAPYGVSSQVQMRQRVQEAKGNKSVPPWQRMGLPAAQGSLRQDVAGIGEGSACIPWGRLSGEPGRLPSPPRHRAAHVGKEVKGMWQSQQVHHKGRCEQTLLGFFLLWPHIQMPLPKMPCTPIPWLSQLCPGLIFFFISFCTFRFSQNSQWPGSVNIPHPLPKILLSISAICRYVCT